MDKVQLLLAQTLIIIKVIIDISEDEKVITLADTVEEKVKKAKELIG